MGIASSNRVGSDCGNGIGSRDRIRYGLRHRTPLPIHPPSPIRKTVRPLVPQRLATFSIRKIAGRSYG